tara:strand:+ start:381 stop:782 length:402 start_codon:yes stop_codon:yes gene_type:complete
MKVIWTNGCFDILHRGHVEMFKYAKSLGDKLVVGIDSDKKVREDKGDMRPINNQDDRKFLLESIKWVDRVNVFNTQQELENMIQYTEPDIMIIGSDWEGKNIVGQQYAKKVIFFDRVGDYSTSNIIKKQGDKL